MSGAGLIELLAARLAGRGARRVAPALREVLAEVSARGANPSEPLITVYRGGGDGQFWTPNAETAAGYGPVRRGMLDTNGFGSAEYTAEMANQSDDFGAFIQSQMARAESENLPGVTLDGIPDLPNWDIQRQYIVRDPSRLRDIADHGPATEGAPSLRDAISKLNATRTTNRPDASRSIAGQIGYHGSNTSGLTELRPGERGPFGPATYISPNEGVAGRYGENLYEVDVPDIFHGLGSSGFRDSSVNPYEVWRSQMARLLEAAEPAQRAEIETIAARMHPQDGYPFFRRIVNLLGSEEAAQALFQRAGFRGISGHVDGPEIAIFGNAPVRPNVPDGGASGARPVSREQLRAEGFDVDRVYYHGTGSDFDSFQTHDGFLGDGVYITPRAGLADWYAGRASFEAGGEGANIRPIHVRGRIKRETREARSTWHRPRAEQARRDGYAGYQAGRDGDIVIFDPANIVSQFGRAPDAPNGGAAGAGQVGADGYARDARGWRIYPEPNPQTTEQSMARQSEWMQRSRERVLREEEDISSARGSFRPRPVGSNEAPTLRTAFSAEEGERLYTFESGDKPFQVTLLHTPENDGTLVTFRAMTGDPYGWGRGQNAADVYRNVIAAIRDDARANPTDAYIIGGFDQRFADVNRAMAQRLARRGELPEGYVIEPGDTLANGNIVIRRAPDAPNAGSGGNALQRALRDRMGE